MRAASADRAAGRGMGRGSVRHEHTASLARCEIARDEPDAHPGQTCSAHRLAVTSRSLTTAADLSVPFARAVVTVRRRGLDHDMKRDELHVVVYSASSSDQTRARKRYRPVHAYVAATFIGAFFPVYPLLKRIEVRGIRHILYIDIPLFRF